MSDIDGAGVFDPYVLRLKAAKEVQAVAKVGFATFASALPETTNIFAYEGPTDKCVFYHWINRLKQGLKYEPYVAKNKRAVLQLFDVLKQDQTGLGDMVYFFVDRDFDQLQGRNEDERIFLTDAYSIENYFVCQELLEDLLKIEFHCDGYPAVRTEISKLFHDAYTQFLKITVEINFRIFVARKFDIRQTEDLPHRINLLAHVEIDSVKPADLDLRDLVKLEREPTEEEIENCKSEFHELDPKTGYRGKFAMLFFSKWLLKLRVDRLANLSSYFKNIPPPEFAVTGDFSLDSLAPKAPAPSRLYDFLVRIT